MPSGQNESGEYGVRELSIQQFRTVSFLVSPFQQESARACGRNHRLSRLERKCAYSKIFVFFEFFSFLWELARASRLVPKRKFKALLRVEGKLHIMQMDEERSQEEKSLTTSTRFGSS